MQNRILSCPVPTNLNPLSPNGFKFSVERLPELTFFCQDVNLPSVTLGQTNIATPFINYAVSGDMLEYGDLTVQFMVDGDMANYIAVHNWLVGLGFPENYQQYTDQTTSTIPKSEVAASMSDATLMILGNNNVGVRTIQFIDCFPISLDSLTFTSATQDVQYLVGNATFRYSYYKFV